MKKILLTIGYFILIIVSSVMIVRYGYNAYLIYQYNRQNYTISATPLSLLNFTQSYIVFYNQGNLNYQREKYEEAVRDYKMALALHMPEKKECDVRVNMALAMLGTIKDTYDDMSQMDVTLQVLMSAKEVLLEDGCAGDDVVGHDEEAQKLKEEIDKMIEELMNQQSQDSGGEESNQSQDEPEEENDNSQDDEKTREEKEQAQQREEMMKNQLKEKQEKAATDREDELSYVESFDEDFNFLNEDPIW